MSIPQQQQPDLLFMCSREGDRLDRFLAEQDTQELFSRSFIERLIAAGQVRVNGEVVRKSHRLSPGEEIAVWLPEPVPRQIVPENYPLEVAFEDEWLAVVMKPAGMSVYPGPGHAAGTFANALAHRFAALAAGHGPLRPGLVHRLDKDTSGLLLVAKDDRTHSLCSTLFRERQVRKEYIALVLGEPVEDAGSLDTGIGRHHRDRKRMAVRDDGKQAVTHWFVEERSGRFAWLRVHIETGRTHQIRVHLEHIMHPVLGDRAYSTARRELAATPGYLHKRLRAIQKKHLQRQMLHAARLAFTHPCTGHVIDITSPPPEDIANAWQALLKMED